MNVSAGGARVATLDPGPMDRWVVSWVEGKIARVDTVEEYGAAVARADQLSRRYGATVKVMAVTTKELTALWYTPPGFHG